MEYSKRRHQGQSAQFPNPQPSQWRERPSAMDETPKKSSIARGNRNEVTPSKPKTPTNKPKPDRTPGRTPEKRGREVLGPSSESEDGCDEEMKTSLKDYADHITRIQLQQHTAHLHNQHARIRAQKALGPIENAHLKTQRMHNTILAAQKKIHLLSAATARMEAAVTVARDHLNGQVSELESGVEAVDNALNAAVEDVCNLSLAFHRLQTSSSRVRYSDRGSKIAEEIEKLTCSVSRLKQELEIAKVERDVERGQIRLKEARGVRSISSYSKRLVMRISHNYRKLGKKVTMMLRLERLNLGLRRGRSGFLNESADD